MKCRKLHVLSVWRICYLLQDWTEILNIELSFRHIYTAIMSI